MRRAGLLMVMAILATACAPLATQADDGGALPLEAPWDFISFETTSWGVPVSSWRLLPDGSGSWTELEGGEPAGFTDRIMRWHELPADPASYRRLQAILERLPFPAPDAGTCENSVTDAPSGALRLTRGSTTVELGFYSGCFDEAYAPYLAALREADQLVAARGRVAPVTRRVRPGGSWIEEN